MSETKSTATKVIQFMKKGDDAISYRLVPSSTSIVISENTAIPNSVSCKIIKTVGNSAVEIINPSDENLTIKYSLINTSLKSLLASYSGGDIDVPTGPTYKAVEFYLYDDSGKIETLTIPIMRDGAEGKPGEDAISIKVSPPIVSFKKNGTRQRVNVYVSLFRGGALIPYNDDSNGKMTCGTLADNSSIATNLRWTFGVDGEQFYYVLTYSGEGDLSMDIPFTVTYNGRTYSDRIVVQTVADGGRGPALRGPQSWGECAKGYTFQCGADGEDWKDVVWHDNNCYSCVKSHVKDADNYPGSDADQSNGYWQLGDKIELVATKILLSTYALVKNLGVECIDMRDVAGNIIFQAKDGNVICKTGTFENVVISGLLRKKKTIVDLSNFSKIFKQQTDSSYYDLDLSNAGTWLDVTFLPKDILIYPKGMRSLVGNTILIYNNSKHSIGLSAPCCTEYNGGPGAFGSFMIEAGKFASLECKVGVKSSEEVAYFVVQTGTINPNLDT